MRNNDTYNTQLVAIINLSDLRPTDTHDDVDYLVNVLAKHPATNRIQVLVLAKNQAGINKFRDDFPNAGIVTGDGTPDNHDEWLMLAYPREIGTSTSPVEVYNRGRQKARGITQHE